MKPDFKSLVQEKDLTNLNKKVYEKGSVDREHLVEFLTYIPTNDGDHIVQEVKQWLYNLHNDPHYSKIVFPEGHIEAVLSDLDSYGRVQPLTILKLKETSGRALPAS